MTERYEEYGGGRSLPPSYDQAKLRDCPTCGAEAGMVCTGSLVVNRVTKETLRFERRKMPCVARIPKRVSA